MVTVLDRVAGVVLGVTQRFCCPIHGRRRTGSVVGADGGEFEVIWIGVDICWRLVIAQFVLVR